MLVLGREEHESLRIGTQIRVTVVRISGNKIRLGIEAPPEMKVIREELLVKADIVPSVVPSVLPQVETIQE